MSEFMCQSSEKSSEYEIIRDGTEIYYQQYLYINRICRKLQNKATPLILNLSLPYPISFPILILILFVEALTMHMSSNVGIESTTQH